MTMNDLFDRYATECIPELLPRTQRDYRGILVYLRAAFGRMQPVDVKPRHIREFLDVATGRIHRNRMVTILSGVFAVAITDWRVDDDLRNPCYGIKLWPTKARNRTVADEELHRFRAICPAQIRIAMDLASLSFLNQTEILGLRWQQIHMQGPRAEWVILPGPGGAGNRTSIPISAPLEAVLTRARAMGPAAPREYVIRTNPRSGKKGQRYTEDGFRAMWQRFMRNYEKAGHPRFHFRDLQPKAPANNAVVPITLTRRPLSARMTSKIFWASLVVQDHIHAPSGVSQETLADERRSIESAGPDGDCIVVYCGANNCGAIYWMGRRLWSMWAPIGPAEFVTLLQTNNVAAKDAKEFVEWRRANLSCLKALE